MTDPVSALVGKWEREAGETNRNSMASILTQCASELREALKLRPRGSAEQAQEIARLKVMVAALSKKP